MALWLLTSGASIEVKARIPIGGEILIEDVNGISRLFTPIAVIHHRGEVIGDTTMGHY